MNMWTKVTVTCLAAAALGALVMASRKSTGAKIAGSAIGVGKDPKGGEGGDENKEGGKK